MTGDTDDIGMGEDDAVGKAQPLLFFVTRWR